MKTEGGPFNPGFRLDETTCFRGFHVKHDTFGLKKTTEKHDKKRRRGQCRATPPFEAISFHKKHSPPVAGWLAGGLGGLGWLAGGWLAGWLAGWLQGQVIGFDV